MRKKEIEAALKKPREIPANCSTESVINGVSRIQSPEIYEWVSDPAQSLPQWLKLDFAAPAQINQISLVFDTDMTNPGTCWTSKIPNVPLCVRDYNVEVFDGRTWTEIANVTDNFMRKRNHSFLPITAETIRITVSRTWGDPSARITEVRASLDE